jgi:hypothetical protein
MGFHFMNVLPTLGMALFLLSFFYSAWRAPKDPDRPELPPWLIATPTGKERNLGGSSRDASMFTQSTRRTAVVNGYWANPDRVLRETPHTSGFTNGALEVFSIGSICTRICAVVGCPNIFDGGTPATEVCDILEGGSPATEATTVWDGGNANSIVCQV